MTVNGRARVRRGRGAHAPRRVPARGAAPDRHPCRLRHRPVRRLRRACGRRCGEGLQRLRRSTSTAPRSAPSRAWPTPTARSGSIQAAFQTHHGLQCGFCTPGHGDDGRGAPEREPRARPRREIREYLEGNICRCTGYHNIVKAIQAARRAGRVGAIAAEYAAGIASRREDRHAEGSWHRRIARSAARTCGS